jgi:hypothetical protein
MPPFVADSGTYGPSKLSLSINEHSSRYSENFGRPDMRDTFLAYAPDQDPSVGLWGCNKARNYRHRPCGFMAVYTGSVEVSVEDLASRILLRRSPTLSVGPRVVDGY